MGTDWVATASLVGQLIHQDPRPCHSRRHRPIRGYKLLLPFELALFRWVLTRLRRGEYRRMMLVWLNSTTQVPHNAIRISGFRGANRKHRTPRLTSRMTKELAIFSTFDLTFSSTRARKAAIREKTRSSKVFVRKKRNATYGHANVEVRTLARTCIFRGALRFQL